jgi:putative DeoR family transcriptional regulator (stage III sporulation protein D)
VSKSTVHKDVTTRLKELNKSLYEKTASILKRNKEERHIRGGAATRAKYIDNKRDIQ